VWEELTAIGRGKGERKKKMVSSIFPWVTGEKEGKKKVSARLGPMGGGNPSMERRREERKKRRVSFPGSTVAVGKKGEKNRRSAPRGAIGKRTPSSAMARGRKK